VCRANGERLRVSARAARGKIAAARAGDRRRIALEADRTFIHTARCGIALIMAPVRTLAIAPAER
jgi:hypothetical protein